jgi:NADPH-dependent 2,4-dienoyl-CoA reductase/sulfur reductase-like enzyme
VSDRTTFIIVGGGLAGAKAAETLRTEGFDGRLVLVDAELELPYEHDIELITGHAAARLDPRRRASSSTTARRCATTGCRSRRAPCLAGLGSRAPTARACACCARFPTPTPA